jgi:hypothetical protein
VSDDLDAFGRKKGDDGLSDLGWGTTGTSSSPTPTPTPVTPSDPPKMTMNTGQPSMPVYVRKGSGFGMRPVVILVAVTVAISGAIIGMVNNTTNKALKTFSVPNFPSTSSGSHTSTVPATDPESSKPPKQVAPLKLFTPGGLKAGLKILERDVPGKVENFRLAADRIDVIIVHGSKRIDAQLTPDAQVANKLSVSESSGAEPDLMNYKQIDVGAPARLIRTSNERVNQSDNDVDYLVWGFAGNNQWNLYYKHGVYTEGDAHGFYVRRIQ